MRVSELFGEVRSICQRPELLLRDFFELLNEHGEVIEGNESENERIVEYVRNEMRNRTSEIAVIDMNTLVEVCEKTGSWRYCSLVDNLSVNNIQAFVENVQNFNNLRRLNLSNNTITTTQINIIRHKNTWSELEELNLTLTRLGEMEAMAWSAVEGLSNVRCLNLSNNRFREAGMAAFVGSEYLANVEELNLTRCGIGDREMRALASPGRFDALEDLDLSDNGFGRTGGFSLFIQSPRVRKLKRLILDRNDISQVGIYSMCERFQLSGLEELSLNTAGLHDGDVTQLSRQEGFRNLKKLSISGNNIRGYGRDELLNSPYIGHLIKEEDL